MLKALFFCEGNASIVNYFWRKLIELKLQSILFEFAGQLKNRSELCPPKVRFRK